MYSMAFNSKLGMRHAASAGSRPAVSRWTCPTSVFNNSRGAARRRLPLVQSLGDAANHAAGMASSGAACQLVHSLPQEISQAGLLPQGLSAMTVASLVQSIMEALHGPMATAADAGAAAHDYLGPVSDSLMHQASSSLVEMAALASDVTIADGLSVLQHSAASLQPALADLAAVGGASATTLHALASWAAERLAVVQTIDMESYDSMAASLQQVVSAATNALSAGSVEQASHLAAGLVLGMQQLVTAITLPPAAEAATGSTITAMAAAQDAVRVAATSAVAEAPAFDGLNQLSLALVAFMAASMPRGDAKNAQKTTGGLEPVTCAKDLPLSYDPEALGAFWSKRPVQVMRRNAIVMGKLSAFVTSILADWRLGRWEAKIKSRATEIRLILESLGPAYVKIGQALSTRVDIIAEPYALELAKLQADVPPFDTAEARAVLEDGLGRPVDAVFEWLSEEPIASASLGQVYKGQLRAEYGGTLVAVKIQRPGAMESVSLDIHIMRRAALIFSKLPGMSAEWATVLDEWATRFFAEMDYQKEAFNTATFKRQMAGLEGIEVADVYPDLTSSKVLVMSWVEGEKLSESSAEDVKKLCSTLLNCYLIQLLETGFLHADPHPGNLLRSAEGRLVILDFGLITEVSEDQRISLVEFITHLSTEDWGGVAHDLVSLGFMPDGLPEGAEKHMAPLMQKIMGQLVRGGGLRNGINVFDLTHELEHVAKAYKIVVPPYFTLVLRAFSTIEGIALKVSPKYSIVSECMPYLSRRLLSDNNPRMRAALRHLLYGDKKRIDVERLARMMAAFSTFSTDTPTSSSPSFGSAFSSSAPYSERVKGRPMSPAPSTLGGLFGGPDEEGPVVTEATKEALRMVFHKNGSFAQELIVEELVAAVDAMSREALGEALRLVLSSATAMSTLRSTEALGPLRAMFMPLPLPMDMLSAMTPTVALSDEDRQALSTIRILLDLLQPSLRGLPGVASGGSRAMRAAGELMPMVPELLPGVQSTLELFVRSLVRRMALRLADDLEPSKRAALEEQQQRRRPQPPQHTMQFQSGKHNMQRQ